MKRKKTKHKGRARAIYVLGGRRAEEWRRIPHFEPILIRGSRGVRKRVPSGASGASFACHLNA